MTETPTLDTEPTAEALDAARALLDLAALDRLDFQPECENPGHAHGHHGCTPENPAAYVWRRTPHPCEKRGALVLLCDGITAWLQTHASTPLTCSDCGQRRALGDAIKLVGPLSQVSGTLTP